MTRQPMFVIVAALILALSSGHGQAAGVVDGLDHVVVVVHDLDAAAARFGELGFTLKPGRPHENGLVNQHVKFPNGTEIELMSVTEPRDALAREYARALEGGEGAVFVALFAPVLADLAARLASEGYATEAGVGVLAFLLDDPLRYLFFGSRNRSNTDRAEHFAHPNGARDLVAVWLAGTDFSAERTLFAALGVTVVERLVVLPDADTVPALVAMVGRGEVVMIPSEPSGTEGRRIVGVTVRVDDARQARAKLAECGIGASPVVATGDAASVFVTGGDLPGFWLELRESGDAPPR